MGFSHEFWINLAAYLLTGLTAIITVTWKISQLATKEELREKVKERNDQINRVYERFDVHKKHTDENFVRKDMCGQLHLTTKDELGRLDKDYKDFRHEIRNTVQQIFDKIDELRQLITERK